MKKTICITLIVLSVFALFAISSSATEKKGISFAVDEFYRTTKSLETHPHTFEAWVNVDKNAPATQLGVIAGNYKDGGTNSYGFEVRTNGNPFLWLGYGATGKRIAFDQIDLRTGEWTHVAITFNSTTAFCYINGELKQTISSTLTDVDMAKTGPLCIGGDLRSANARWLQKTMISSVALYADMRTEDEIKADMENVDLNDENILLAYDFTEANSSSLKDLTSNGLDLNYNGKLLDVEPEEEEKGGLAFTNDPYKLVKKIETPINTLEATVYFPKSYTISDRGGVIFGNYNVTAPCVNFEIYSNGSPRVYITDENGKAYSFVFDKANVYTGKWVHIAVVRENANTMTCYIDGEFVQTISKTVPEAISNDYHILGGDLRSGNAQYFKGRIKNVAMYSDVRTADEIKADVTAPGKDEGLIFNYDLDGLENPKIVEDKSGNGYNAKLKATYFTEKDPLEDYAYSFAVIGDTQILAENYPNKYTALYDWVIGNIEQKNIKFVFGLGDITNSSTTAEWELAKQNISRLNGVVPYSLVRGNHDTTTSMNKYFPLSEYEATLGGCFSNNIFNSWQELIVGQTKYLIFTLDYGAPDSVLNWASEIIEAHPYHNVIITTHAYLFRDGTTLDKNDVCPPSGSGSSLNNGDHMWDKLMKKHENIVLVLSGHDPCDYVVTVQTEGENGNIVTQMLVDPQGVDSAQGGVGLVTMLYFSEDGKTVQVETYSTDKKAFFLEDNQYTYTLNVVDPEPAGPEEIEIRPWSYGWENWSEQTQLLIVAPISPDDRTSEFVWEITIGDKTFKAVPSSNYDLNDGTAIWRFETCLLEGDNKYVPTPGATHTITANIYEGETLIMTATTKDGAVWTVPADLVPVDPDAPVEPDEPIDPPTGDNTVFAVVFILISLFGMAVVATKKVRT